MTQKMKGQIATSVVITGASMLVGVFAWAYQQFTSVNAHAADTDVKVAAVTQRTQDIDTRLTRIEDKQDKILNLIKNR